MDSDPPVEKFKGKKKPKIPKKKFFDDKTTYKKIEKFEEKEQLVKTVEIDFSVLKKKI